MRSLDTLIERLERALDSGIMKNQPLMPADARAYADMVNDLYAPLFQLAKSMADFMNVVMQ